jgi:hypothetical protein
LIAHLNAIGAYENIIFVFLSDNGAESTDPMNMGACKRLNANLLYDQSIAQQGRLSALTAQEQASATALGTTSIGWQADIRINFVFGLVLGWVRTGRFWLIGRAKQNFSDQTTCDIT